MLSHHSLVALPLGVVGCKMIQHIMRVLLLSGYIKC